MSSTNNARALLLMFGTLVASNVIGLEERELRGKNMGSSVAMDGDYAVVGASSGDNANNHVGSVYVFKRAGNGSWSQTAVLTADDGGSHYAFGNSVGISGDWIIVGSRDWGFSNPISIGHVYFFKRNVDETWTQKASLGPTLFEQGQVTAAFGASVAIKGDYAVAGDPGYGVDRRGSVTLFQRVGDVWNVVQSTGHQPGRVIALGYSVDICMWGNTPVIVAGAPESYFPDHLERYYGRAFFFILFNGSLQVVEIVCEDLAHQTYFGHAVSIDYNDRGKLTAAVGACLNDDYQGAVYVFDFGAIMWTQRAKLSRPPLEDGTGYYGTSVSLRNDTLAVGLSWVGGIDTYGFNPSVWLYYRDQGGPNQWGLFDQVRPCGYAAQEMAFGDTWLSGGEKGVALSGNSLIVKARFRTYQVDGVNTSGAAFVFGANAASGLRPDVAGVRISEIADNSVTVGPKTAYIELYNPTNVAVSLKDTLLAVERPSSGGQLVTGKDSESEGSTTDYYSFPPFVTIPSNGCLVVSAGALKDEFEQSWSVDLGTAPYNYEIGTPNLHLAEGCSYRLEQVNRGSVPHPDTTNVLDSTVACPGGCRAVHFSAAADDWRYDNSYVCSPGARDGDQFVYSARTLPFSEDWSSYDFTSNNWSFTGGQKGHWSAIEKYPTGIATFYWAPHLSSSFSYGLETPLLSGRAKETVLLGFDLQLDMTFGVNKGYTMEVQVATTAGGWNTVATYRDTLGDTTWNGQSLDLSPYARDQYFRVRFLVSGANTTYLNEWILDNVSITATEPEVTPPTITGLTLNPRMHNSLQMFWTAGSNGRLHRVFYGTNLLEGINQPLGIFSESSFLMQPPPDVNGAPAVFFRIQSLP